MGDSEHPCVVLRRQQLTSLSGYLPQSVMDLGSVLQILLYHCRMPSKKRDLSGKLFHPYRGWFDVKMDNRRPHSEGFSRGSHRKVLHNSLFGSYGIFNNLIYIRNDRFIKYLKSEIHE